MDSTTSTGLDNTICPVARTAEIISGKWTLLIIRDLASGVKRFNQLERSLRGISPKPFPNDFVPLKKKVLSSGEHSRKYPPASNIL